MCALRPATVEESFVYCPQTITTVICTHNSDAMKYDRFLGWAKARGIKLADGVAVMNFEGTGRGLGVGTSDVILHGAGQKWGDFWFRCPTVSWYCGHECGKSWRTEQSSPWETE